MRDIAKRQTLHIWIVMLTMLFSALAPAISPALAAAGTSANMVEICTVNGYKLVKAADFDGSKKPVSTNHSMKHCALCAIHGDTYALTGSPSVVLALDLSHDIYPRLFYVAQHSLHVWSSANPRAPPLLT